MRVRVTYSTDVDDYYRRAINQKIQRGEEADS